jgi:hypothetical protein
MKNEKSAAMTMSSPMSASGNAAGIAPTVISTTTELADKATRAGFATVQDVRAELGRRVLATIDWVDQTQQGTLRLGRELAMRTDQLVSDVFSAGEVISLRVISLAQRVSLVAVEASGQLAAGLVEGLPAAERPRPSAVA